MYMLYPIDRVSRFLQTTRVCPANHVASHSSTLGP